MSLLEGAVSLLAPHLCLGCGLEGTLLCRGCMYSSLVPLPSRCYRCHRISQQFAVCSGCRRSVKLRRVWLCTEYNGLAKDLIHVLKFERGKAAASAIAEWLGEQLPLLDTETIVTSVPTANSRVRMRGYDQSRLIAKSLADRRGLIFHDSLIRRGSVRQVGSSRKERLNQLETAFQPYKPELYKDRHILLVDDVLTTGATIEAAAKALKAAGAKSVEAAIFAH